MPLPDAALLIEEWAATGDRILPENRTPALSRAAGWPASWSSLGGNTPSREVFNQLFGEITAYQEYIRDHGSMAEWHALVVYSHPATVIGSNNTTYVSVQGSTGENPVTDTANVYWMPLLSSIPASAITSGTINRARLPLASSSNRGIIEIASATEAADGISSTRAVPPAHLNQADVDQVDGWHVRVLTETEFQAITTPDPNTLYFRT